MRKYIKKKPKHTGKLPPLTHTVPVSDNESKRIVSEYGDQNEDI
jgi:hypothetical protein